MTDDPGRSASRRTGAAGASTGADGVGSTRTGGGTGSGTGGADFDFGAGHHGERVASGGDRNYSGTNRGASTLGTDTTRAPARRHTSERRSTETKAAFKTTELIAYLGVLAAILIAGLIADDAGAGGFGVQQVWLYATILTVGYMISRGLAKSGSYDADDH